MQTIADMINKGYDNITLKGNTEAIRKATRQAVPRSVTQEIAIDRAVKEMIAEANEKARQSYTRQRQVNPKQALRHYKQIDGGDFGGKLTEFKFLMQIKMGEF